MVLIDLSKAFVSINHQAMFNIPERITKAITLKCSNIKGEVLSPDGETDYFTGVIFSGVMLGDFGTIFICHCG